MNIDTARNVLAWLLTYSLHSTVLLGLAWVVLRIRRAEPAAADVLWKLALVGGILTASAQMAFDVRPAGSVALSRPAAKEWTPPTANDGSAYSYSFKDKKTPPPNANISLLDNSGQVPSTPGTASPAALPDASASAAAPSWATSALLALAWFSVAGILILWYAARRLILVGRLGDRRTLSEGETLNVMNALTRDAGVSFRIRLTVSHAISSPVALGRHEICLPAAALVELDAVQQRAMLAHELAHLVRRDPMWLAFACMMERAFFFQPLNRLARKGMQQSAEYLADEWAASQSGNVPLARCLVKVAEWLQASPLGVPVAGMAEERSQLTDRVARLLNANEHNGKRPGRPLAFLALAVLAATVWFAPGVMGRGASASPTTNTTWVDPNSEDCCVNGGIGARPPVGPDMPDLGDLSININTKQIQRDAMRMARSAMRSAGLGDGDMPADTTVIRALMIRLKEDVDPDVRRAAANSLGNHAHPMSIGTLVTALDDKERDVRVAVLEALSSFEKGVPAAPIRKLLDSSDLEIQHAALHLIGMIKDHESIPQLTKLLRSQDPDIREMAIDALEEIGDPTAANAIIVALSDVSPDVRRSAISALNHLEAPLSDEVMLKVLRDNDADVRDEALSLASDRKLVSLVPEIIKMLDDKDAQVRECAAETLTEMGTESARSALKKAMTHSDPKVRKVAVEYFGNGV